MNFIKLSALVLLFASSIILLINPKLLNGFSLNLYAITVVLTTLAIALEDFVDYNLKIKQKREEKQKLEKQVEETLFRIINKIHNQI